ncbi:hypothetical protein [Ignatzschineria sp. LJL83]
MKIKLLALASFTLLSVLPMGFAGDFGVKSLVKVPKIDASIGEYAYLRDRLPQDTIAYVRLANPVSQFFSPKNRTNDEALTEKVSINALKEYREVIGNEVVLRERIQSLGLNFSEENLNTITLGASLLYKVLNGPIEVAALSEDGTYSLLAKGLISIPVNIASIEALNSILQDDFFSQMKEPLQFNKEGFAATENAVFYFAPKTKRIMVKVGLNPGSFEDFKKEIQALKVQKNHEMYAFENQIDLTGQNNFLWMDLRNKSGLIEAAGASHPIYPYAKEINGFAMGDGTNDIKQGQMKFVIQADTEKLLGINPKAHNDFSFKTVGTPKGAVLLPTPTEATVHRMIELYLIGKIKPSFASEYSPSYIVQQRNEIYSEFTEKWQEKVGFSFTEMMNLLGPNMTIYYDDIGAHTVISIRDKKKFYQWLEAKNSEGVLSYKKHQKMHHLSIQNPLLKMVQQEDILNNDEVVSAVIAYPFVNEMLASSYGVRMLDLNFHFYWSDEEDYIRISQLPQIVEEEQKFGKEKFSQWLTKKQGINSENILLAATMDWKNVDRNWYYNYLQVLQNNADVLGTKFDVAKMPRADQLGFADSSRIGFQVSADQEFLSISLDYGSEAGFLNSISMPVLGSAVIESLIKSSYRY